MKSASTVTLVAVAIAAGCGGSGTEPVRRDAPVVGDSGSSVPTGAPFISGDTLTAATDRVELAAGPGVVLAAWLDPAQHVAHGVIANASGSVVGAPVALALANAVEVRALAFGGALAAGVTTADGGVYLVAFDPVTGAAATPVPLTVPTGARCRFAPPSLLACTTGLGALHADPALGVAFGPPQAMPDLPFDVRFAGADLVYVDAAGCVQAAAVADTLALGPSHQVGCATTAPVATATLAVEPQPTSETAAGRAYANLDATCAFVAWNAAGEPVAPDVRTRCPVDVAWSFGETWALQIEANGTADAQPGDATGVANQPVMPILGIGHLQGGAMLADPNIGLAFAAILDGARLQFAVFAGVPI